jgi:hypothetical protein
MPFLVEPAGEVVVDGAGAVVDGAGAGLDCVVGLAAGVEELDEVEPHAARPSAASARTPAAKRRIVLDMVVVMFAPSCPDRNLV